MSRPSLAIVGAGRLALSIARILGDKTQTKVWARREEALEALSKECAPSVSFCRDLGEAIEGSEIIFLAVPADGLEDVARLYGDHARGDHVVLLATRGVGEDFVLPHDMVRARTCARKIGVIGGPLHTRELALGRPLSAVLASRFDETIEAVSALLKGAPITIGPTRDVIGVEVAGAISNVSAIAGGMSEALKMGDTARGVLLTHGLSEARQLGIALGAEAATFAGLAGVGDLIPRKVTSTERHASFGHQIVLLPSLEEAMGQVEGTLEGVRTCRAAVHKGRSLGLELPFLEALNNIIDAGASPGPELERILRLPIRL